MRRIYDGWLEGDELDRQAASVLAYLDRIGETLDLQEEAVAHVDEYGVVTSTLSPPGDAQLYLQAGDGWDRVLWTCPSGRVYEWTWRDHETPDDVDAVLNGHGVERETWFGARRLGAELRVGDRRLAVADGCLRLALARVLGIRLRVKERRAR